jgi:hypothetical protein
MKLSLPAAEGKTRGRAVLRRLRTVLAALSGGRPLGLFAAGEWTDQVTGQITIRVRSDGAATARAVDL